jgi:MYXO-CTERM domain-containing protein
MKTTNVIVGTAFSLVLAGVAQASPFQGFHFENMGNYGNGETYRMYVELDAGARIDAVFGNSAGDLSIGTAAGMSFYQDGYGGPTSTSTNSDFFPLAPALEWDSYVTIGALYANGTPFGNNALLDIGIDWASFNGGGPLETDNGSWFVTPADAQGGEVDGMVLIGQFTVMGGTGDARADLLGQVSLQGKDAAGDTFQELGATWAVVPAPGAIALLGLAGVCSRRRRK